MVAQQILKTLNFIHPIFNVVENIIQCKYFFFKPRFLTSLVTTHLGTILASLHWVRKPDAVMLDW